MYIHENILRFLLKKFKLYTIHDDIDHISKNLYKLTLVDTNYNGVKNNTHTYEKGAVSIKNITTHSILHRNRSTFELAILLPIFKGAHHHHKVTQSPIAFHFLRPPLLLPNEATGRLASTSAPASDPTLQIQRYRRSMESMGIIYSRCVFEARSRAWSAHKPTHQYHSKYSKYINRLGCLLLPRYIVEMSSNRLSFCVELIETGVNNKLD